MTSAYALDVSQKFMTKIKIQTIVFIIALSLLVTLEAAPTSVVADTEIVNINIPEGKKLKILNWGANTRFARSSWVWFSFVIPDPKDADSELIFPITDTTIDYIYGPGTLRLYPGTDQFATDSVVYILYDIIDYSSRFNPSGTATIPQSSGGEFLVTMESSTDLSNWSPANNGTYSSETEAKFFRVTIKRNDG